jgi:cation diffusion facilitator CzcD-associated flavoprotein CzcO
MDRYNHIIARTMGQATVDVDYLVAGAGAAAMAFVDAMLATSDATFAIVDRRAQPGGHWNDAYPFVRLHQPSTAYGVNSTELGDGSVDAVGLNKGLRELASGMEVLGYFDRLMQRRFLPSGRVRYFPMSEHTVDRDRMH